MRQISSRSRRLRELLSWKINRIFLMNDSRSLFYVFFRLPRSHLHGALALGSRPSSTWSPARHHSQALDLAAIAQAERERPPAKLKEAWINSYLLSTFSRTLATGAALPLRERNPFFDDTLVNDYNMADNLEIICDICKNIDHHTSREKSHAY